MLTPTKRSYLSCFPHIRAPPPIQPPGYTHPAPFQPQIPPITTKIFESTTAYITCLIILRIIKNELGFLHTGNEEDHEDRVSKEGRPPLREDLLCPHDPDMRPLRAL